MLSVLLLLAFLVAPATALASNTIRGIGPYFLGMTVDQLHQIDMKGGSLLSSKQIRQMGPNVSEAYKALLAETFARDAKALSAFCKGMEAWTIRNGGTYLQLNGSDRNVEADFCTIGGKLQVMSFTWPMSVFSGGVDLYESSRWLRLAVERTYGLHMEQVSAMTHTALDDKGNVVQIKSIDEGF